LVFAGFVCFFPPFLGNIAGQFPFQASPPFTLIGKFLSPYINHFLYRWTLANSNDRVEFFPPPLFLFEPPFFVGGGSTVREVWAQRDGGLVFLTVFFFPVRGSASLCNVRICGSPRRGDAGRARSSLVSGFLRRDSFPFGFYFFAISPSRCNVCSLSPYFVFLASSRTAMLFFSSFGNSMCRFTAHFDV